VTSKSINAGQIELQAELAQMGGAALHDQPCPCVKCRGNGAKKAEAAANQPVWGEFAAHGHGSVKNLTNAVLCALAVVPSVVLTTQLYGECDSQGPPLPLELELNFTSFGSMNDCIVAIHHPMVFANILFFINITIGFWVIGCLQKSFWLIDPYWTLLPPLLGHL
jgi:hypothetical protein